MLSLKKYNILLVENDNDVIDTFSDILEMKFNKVFYAKNGIEGLQTVKENHLDLIITDIIMPEMGGIEFIKELRDIKSNLPVVVTISFSDVKFLQETKSLGISNYLVRPIGLSTLIDTCKRILDI